MTERFFHYRAFGFRIRSAIALQELEVGETGDWDITIVLGTVDRPDPPSPGARAHDFGLEEQYLAIGSIGKFLIRDADTIIVDLADGFPLELAGYALLGPVMALFLHQRGKFVLHGSALLVEGQAVIFVGDKGAGKSTTAGAFVGAGYSLITDDVVAVDWSESGEAQVAPSYPTMKLTRAALEAIGVDRFTVLPPPAENFLKHRVSPNGAAPAGPVPIAAIYALERGGLEDAARIVSYSGPESLRLLLANSYMARYGRDAFAHEGGMANHLDQCARVLKQAQCGVLHVSSNLDHLADAVAAVVGELSLRASAS